MNDERDGFDWILATDRFEKVWFPRVMISLMVAAIVIAGYLIATGQ